MSHKFFFDSEIRKETLVRILKLQLGVYQVSETARRGWTILTPLGQYVSFGQNRFSLF